VYIKHYVGCVVLTPKRGVFLTPKTGVNPTQYFVLMPLKKHQIYLSFT